jgi:hypothetical protein
MTVKKWLAKNCSLGGLISNAGKGAGIVAHVGLHGVGIAAEFAADSLGSRHGKAIGNTLKKSGEVANLALTGTGMIAGYVANKTTEYAGVAGGAIAVCGAYAAGANNSTLVMAHKIGTTLGVASVGTLAWVGLAETVVALAAAPGTFGAAATSSGLAALGGGSLASGGGGMAVGQVVAQGIVTLTRTSALLGASLDSNENPNIETKNG